MRRRLIIKLSLRELVALIAFFALGLASLRLGGVLASLSACAGIVVVMAFAIVAFVGHAQPRAFAIGFLLPVIVYASTILASGEQELDPYTGRLPTTQVLRYAHQGLVTATWIDALTGKEDPDYDPSTFQGTGIGNGAFGGTTMMLQEYPDRPTFMTLAHLMIAMTLGWVGGKFAIFIHRTQHPEFKNSESTDQRPST